MTVFYIVDPIKNRRIVEIAFYNHIKYCFFTVKTKTRISEIKIKRWLYDL